MNSVAVLTVILHLPAVTGRGVPGQVLGQIQKSTRRFGELLLEQAQKSIECPKDLKDFEESLHSVAPRECIDPVTEAIIAAALEDPVVQMKAEALLDSDPHLHLQCSDQKVTIDLLGGGKATVNTDYHLRRPPKKDGKRPRKGQRGKSGNGVYPALAVLGIHERLTPAYGSLIAREFVRGSFDETQDALARRGVRRDRKAIRRVVHIVSQRALNYQKRLAENTSHPKFPAWDLRGKRIGICIDGGRVRTRVRKPGRRRKSGGKSYKTDWKEPRVIVIYELDGKGRKRRRGYVRYDATIATADDTFARLASILRELGANLAIQWVIGGDGAKWIWKDRVAKLIELLGYDPARVVEFVDFYHAVEYLTEFAELRSDWDDKERKQWIRRVKRSLKKGNVERILEEMRPYCVGRNAKKLKKVVRRFELNKERMRYAHFRKMGLPCGSGVVESAVRRIVNLRLKGAGIFWDVQNAEGLLHLRARYLSGDWDSYMSQIFEPATEWQRESCPIVEDLVA